MKTFVRAGTPPGAKTAQAVWYVSPNVFARERECIFGREWICVGREERVANAGDYVVGEIAGESLIVTRDGNGKLHAFYNVCRHRGSRMCEAESGRFGGSIQCPYHAWTYRLDGTLRAARNMEDVSGFDVADYRLAEAKIASFEGFVFVNLDAAAPPFAQTFSPLIGRFSDWQLASLRTGASITYDVACNWKLVFLNYSECYHCPGVHPQLEKLSPWNSGRNDLTEGAFLGGYSQLRHAGGSLTTTGKTARAPIGSVHGEDLNRVYYYTIFPSMLLSLHPDYAMVHYIRPLGHDRTRVECAWLFDPGAVNDSAFDPSDAVDFWDLTNRQDWHVSELTQLGLQSRAYEPGPYSNAEGLLSAFDRHYLELMQQRAQWTNDALK